MLPEIRTYINSLSSASLQKIFLRKLGAPVAISAQPSFLVSGVLTSMGKK
jgi:hypothetical protein